MNLALPISFVLYLAIAAAPGWAQELPPLHPSRDAAVTYRAEFSAAGTSGPQSRTLHLYWGADGTKLRVEVEGQPGIALIDFRAHRMQVLLPTEHVVVDGPFQEGIVPGFIFPPGTTADRGGTDTVAGKTCDVWTVRSARGAGHACVTRDGILLRADGGSADRGEGQLLATSVNYEPQPSSLFAAPADFRRMDPTKPRR